MGTVSPSQRELRKRVYTKTGKIPAIGFPFGSAYIEPDKLDHQVDRWTCKARLTNPDEIVYLLGFSSRPGSRRQNYGLAKRRTQFVYDHLVRMGASCRFRFLIFGEDLWRLRDSRKGRGPAAERFDHPYDRVVGVAFGKNDVNKFIGTLRDNIKFPSPSAPKRPDKKKQAGKAFLKYLKELAKSLAKGGGAPAPGPGFGVELGKEYLKSLSEKNKAMAIIAHRAGLIVGIEAANVISERSSSLSTYSFTGAELRKWIDSSAHLKGQILTYTGTLVRTFAQWRKYYLRGVEQMGSVCTSLLTDTRTHVQRKSRIQAFVKAARKARKKQVF